MNIHFFVCSNFKLTKNKSVHKIKNMEACTHLSKLNNSNQLALGIRWPGVAHKAKIIAAQINESNGLLLYSSFFKWIKNICCHLEFWSFSGRLLRGFKLFSIRPATRTDKLHKQKTLSSRTRKGLKFLTQKLCAY